MPHDVKAEFDKAFGDQNKSSIIAELMLRAVRERQIKLRRERLFHQLNHARPKRPSFTSTEGCHVSKQINAKVALLEVIRGHRITS